MMITHHGRFLAVKLWSIISHIYLYVLNILSFLKIRSWSDYDYS